MSAARIIAPHDIAAIVATIGLDQMPDDLIERLRSAFDANPVVEVHPVSRDPDDPYEIVRR